MAREARIYTVSQLNQYLKNRMDEDPNLGSIYVRGEISNYKCYPSGHHYFSLKDGEGVLRCVMFRSSAQRLRFRPENGLQVVAFGRVTVYPRDGQYQLYVELLTADGVGDLHVAFEQLKRKMSAQGLYDPAHKKPIPRYPDTVAIITSGAGAAIRDMLRILGARWPMARAVVLPVRVQGKEAPAELCWALDLVDQWGGADVILLGRGGGSVEDLWAFNDEALAKAIYRCETPVISAVGHEPDVTISDYVADLRAATPSNGAELAVPDQQEEYVRLRQLQIRQSRAMRQILHLRRSELDRALARRGLRQPQSMVQDRRMELDRLESRMRAALERKAAAQRSRFTGLVSALDSLSPLKVLQRGYGLARDGQGHAVTSVEQVSPGDSVRLRLTDGVLHCTVTEKEGL